MVDSPIHYPTRPTTPPPLFKVFHKTDDSLTLVTKETAPDDEIAAIVWELRDAAQSHGFNALHIPQTFIDQRAPIVFMHIYRGSKCASEKYGSGPLPCGHSYHAAGEFTYGGFSNHERKDGALLKDEDHQTELWDPNGAVSR